MVEGRSGVKILTGKPTGKRFLGRPRKDDLKINKCYAGSVTIKHRWRV